MAEFSNGTSVDFGQKGMRRVVCEHQPVAFGNTFQGMHVTWHTVHMHAQDRFRLGRDHRFDSARIDTQGVGADVAEDWRRTDPRYAVRGCGKGEWRRDNFALYAQRT